MLARTFHQQTTVCVTLKVLKGHQPGRILELLARLATSETPLPAVVSEAAQRISRLALGAATENIHTDPYAQMTD